jgi:hypothetical protein
MIVVQWTLERPSCGRPASINRTAGDHYPDGSSPPGGRPATTKGTPSVHSWDGKKGFPYTIAPVVQVGGPSIGSRRCERSGSVAGLTPGALVHTAVLHGERMATGWRTDGELDLTPAADPVGGKPRGPLSVRIPATPNRRAGSLERACSSVVESARERYHSRPRSLAHGYGVCQNRAV